MFYKIKARLAQLVEHLICNQAVVGSSPVPGSIFNALNSKELRAFFVSGSPLQNLSFLSGKFQLRKVQN